MFFIAAEIIAKKILFLVDLEIDVCYYQFHPHAGSRQNRERSLKIISDETHPSN
jgi:hypothetical protein